MERLLQPRREEEAQATKDEGKELASLEFGTSRQLGDAHRETLQRLDHEEEQAQLLKQQWPVTTPPGLALKALVPKRPATEESNPYHEQDREDREVGCHLLRNHYPKESGQQHWQGSASKE